MANRGRIRAAEGIGGRVKFLPLAWAGMPKTSFPKNSDSLINLQLAKLDTAISPDDMDLANWRLHPLKGQMQNHWAVWVDKNWRITFKFEGNDAVLVDYQDYH